MRKKIYAEDRRIFFHLVNYGSIKTIVDMCRKEKISYDAHRKPISESLGKLLKEGLLEKKGKIYKLNFNNFKFLDTPELREAWVATIKNNPEFFDDILSNKKYTSLELIEKQKKLSDSIFEKQKGNIIGKNSAYSQLRKKLKLG